MYLGLYTCTIKSVLLKIQSSSSRQIRLEKWEIILLRTQPHYAPYSYWREAACTGWEEGIVFAEAEVQKEIEMYGRYPVYADRLPEAYGHIAQPLQI